MSPEAVSVLVWVTVTVSRYSARQHSGSACVTGKLWRTGAPLSVSPGTTHSHSLPASHGSQMPPPARGSAQTAHVHASPGGEHQGDAVVYARTDDAYDSEALDVGAALRGGQSMHSPAPPPLFGSGSESGLAHAVNDLEAAMGQAGGGAGGGGAAAAPLAARRRVKYVIEEEEEDSEDEDGKGEGGCALAPGGAPPALPPVLPPAAQAYAYSARLAAATKARGQFSPTGCF